MTGRRAHHASLFTSRREQRLWAWTLVVVVAIYSTLGLAQTLAGALRDRDLLAAAFGLGMLLVAATVASLALTRRPGRAEIGVGLGVAAVYFMVFLRMALPEERSHIIEYSVVAAFVYEALTERAGHGQRVPLPALLAILVTGLIGALDECIQAILPSRVFDPQDILFNVLAGTMAVTASVTLDWARRRRPMRRPPSTGTGAQRRDAADQPWGAEADRTPDVAPRNELDS